MQLHVLVEEPSAEEALKHLLPRLVRGRAAHKVINMGSKAAMLQKLPERLAAYRTRIAKGEPLRLVVLIDKDSDRCEALKGRLESIAHQAGLATKTSPMKDRAFHLVTRIAVEELEAWFLGDPLALRVAFRGLDGKPWPKRFSNPDNVAGGTWEALHRYLRQHNIYPGTYPKIEAARLIAPHLEVERNASHSFRAFCGGVEALLAHGHRARR